MSALRRHQTTFTSIVFHDVWLLSTVDKEKANISQSTSLARYKPMGSQGRDPLASPYASPGRRILFVVYFYFHISCWISGVSGSVAPLALCLAVALRCQISPPPPAASNREEKAVPLCGVIMSFALRFQSRLMTDHLIM